ncbi:MAG TPA: 50S ribosomal protein L11 methyltransferase [Puia sp.]|jgi:ribosomal protein L11 methyltransferase|nr:50S ribosomal protein L11 methyltransferase [Puia sp.]
MNYIQITIPVTGDAIREMLIARLSEFEYEGFEEQESSLQAFIPEEKFNPTELKELLAPWELPYTQDRLGERNWNEEWEKNFQPVVVEEFCAIRASFHAPIEGVEQELVITPKMSFGTGHHATTYMMVAAMRHLDLKDKQVLDFGTGTGVLAILAEKLGAARVLGIDYDDWSIENALENVSENHCRTISIQKADTTPKGQLFDIILANINKHVILQELHAIGQQLEKEGVILLSGLLHEDFSDIEKEALKSGLVLRERMARGNWICLKLGKRTSLG